MRPPRIRVRTLLVLVGLVAVLIQGAMLGSRSYRHWWRAEAFGEQGRRWGEIAARKGALAEFDSECTAYFAGLARKYRRAAWRPWMPVAPDPPAPGAEAYRLQEEAAGL